VAAHELAHGGIAFHPAQQLILFAGQHLRFVPDTPQRGAAAPRSGRLRNITSISKYPSRADNAFQCKTPVGAEKPSGCGAKATSRHLK